MQNVVSQIGSRVIRGVAKSVGFPISKRNGAIIDQLVTQMRGSDLVGMAAPQIGKSVQIFATEVRSTKFRDREPDKLRVFVNPQILYYSAETEVGYEGCGSVADSNLFGEVERALRVQVAWQDKNGNPRKGTFEGFLARVIQHELDHLKGIVFLDRLTSTQTVMSGSEFGEKKKK